MSYFTYEEHPDDDDPDHWCPYCNSGKEPRLEESEPCAWWICVDCGKVVDSYEPDIDHCEEQPLPF